MEKYKNNPRKWTAEQKRKLRDNLRELGDISGVVHDLNSDQIVGGNFRSEVFDINNCEIEIITKFDEPNAQGTVALGFVVWEGNRYNYRQVRWTKEQCDKACITANSLGGEWDTEILQEFFDCDLLSDWGVDIEFEEPEEKREIVEDDFDESSVIIEKRVSAGDIWQLGEHRLMCGDSTKSDNVAKLMAGELADLLLTDPPYNVAYQGSTKDKLTIMNDKQEDESFRQFLRDAYKACDENMKSGAAFYIWHADSEGYNFRGACRDVGWKVRECLIWNKNSLVLGRQDYHWKHEPCLYGWKEGAPHNWYSDRSQTTVLDFNRPQRSEEHPTMKPVELFAYLIGNSTKKSDIVLDTFGGSGTSIIASEQLGRKCRTMELDPHYCDVIITRWEQMTGKTAKKNE